MNDYIHGVINPEDLNEKADYLFRVSIKGLVRNDKDEVLVVKETGRTWWDLPGGGMDHEESIKQAIARELREEVNLIGDFTYHVIAVEEPSFLQRAKIWQIRLIFEVMPENMTFEPGDDGDEVMFINPEKLRDSDDLAERKVYEYSLLATQ
jgi:8-oxo-dGTP diphosphatase